MSDKENPIYCIGDSHASFFSGRDGMQPAWPAPAENALPFFRVIRLGPVLAYSLYRSGSQSRGRENLFKAIRKIPARSKVLLCFGEIDCRNHILKQAELQKREIESVVAECVERYTSVAGELMHMGFEIILWGVPASSPDNFAQNNEFPTYGNCTDRNRATIFFNRFLAQWCLSNSAKFISIFDELIDEDGRTKKDLYSDQIHLSQKAMPLVIARMRKILTDVNFDAMPAIVVITPAGIDAPAKISRAQEALNSLQNAMKIQWPHIVVENILSKECGGISRLLKPGLANLVKKVYTRPNITFIRRFRGGSCRAVLHAVSLAYDDAADLVFIHLGENIYNRNLDILLHCARDAFRRFPDLAFVRLGGYPLTSSGITRASADYTLSDDRGEISFDAVHLLPDRQNLYTLWWSHFHENMNKGKFLPVAMNFTVYRTGFLLRLLSSEDIARLDNLSDIEHYFKEDINWQKVVQTMHGKLGFINMQSCGISANLHPGWQNLVSLPDDEIR